MLINVRVARHNGMLILLCNDQLTNGHADGLMK
jgi:hypothetical protein